MSVGPPGIKEFYTQLMMSLDYCVPITHQMLSEYGWAEVGGGSKTLNWKQPPIGQWGYSAIFISKIMC